MLCSACGRDLVVDGLFPGAAVRCACGLSQPVVVGGAVPAAATARPRPPTTGGGRGCPRCNVALEVRESEGVIVAVCPSHHGLFVTQAALRAVKGAPAAAQALDVLDRGAANRANDDDASLACPTCGETMSRKTVGRDVEVDVCATHGTWFDSGELRAALAREVTTTGDLHARANATLDVALALEAARDADTMRAGIETADDLLDTFNLFVLGRPSLRRRY